MSTWNFCKVNPLKECNNITEQYVYQYQNTVANRRDGETCLRRGKRKLEFFNNFIIILASR